LWNQFDELTPFVLLDVSTIEFQKEREKKERIKIDKKEA
jgi:hypothetical protein